MIEAHLFPRIVALLELRASELPEGQEQELWTNALGNLVTLMAETMTHLSPEQLTTLTGIGALMMRQAQKEAEALAMAGDLLGAIRRSGGIA